MQNNAFISLKKKRMPALFGCLLVTASAFSQELTISGTVLDSAGEPVIGANVVQQGTTNGAVTDLNGKFSLNVPKGSILLVSYIGYTDQNVTVSGNQPIIITLKDNTELLDEVVVIGYGTMKKAT